jgi:cell wall-associated NlpC family hydrolase
LLNVTDLIGIPYVRNGSDLNGFDCFSLVQEVYRRIGKEIPNINFPEEIALISELGEEKKDELTDKIDSPEPYCLVTFRTVGDFVSHIGVVLEDCNTFIHTTKRKNVTVEKLDSMLWKQKVKEFRKWKNFN